jgi:HAD superfamily hydrolase (TIGR01549 family)
MNTSKKIKVVVFDCDGVMFDSRQANVNFYNYILAHFDLPPMSKSDEPYVHMHTAKESVEHIFRSTPHHIPAAQEYRLTVNYKPFIKDMLIEPHLKDLLEDLKANFGLAVATNRSNTIAEVLRSNSLLGYFDIVVSSLDVNHPKPHPEALFKILNFFRLPAERICYVGDSSVDYETARAAGVPFVSYKNPDLAADYHIERLLEIREIVERPGRK